MKKIPRARKGLAMFGVLLAAALAAGWALIPSGLMASIKFDGVNEAITADGGVIDFDDENLTTTGTTTTNALTISGLDCSGNANGGALTANALGAVTCSDDDGGEGGGGTDTQLWSGSGFINAGSQIRYGALGDTNQVTEPRASFPTPRSGTLKNLYVFADPAVDGNASVDVTVRVNETDTPLTVTIDASDGTSVDSDLVGTVAVTAGQKISIQFKETTGNVPTGSSFRATFELEG